MANYLTKREIVVMDNEQLLEAFERAVTNLVISQNHRARIAIKAVKELEWCKEELLTRLK